MRLPQGAVKLFARVYGCSWMVLVSTAQPPKYFVVFENGNAKFPRVGAAAEWPGRVREGALAGCAWGRVYWPEIVPNPLQTVRKWPGCGANDF